MRLKDEPYKFQFPSNGKVYPKQWSGWELGTCHNQCFNSLQTGRCIQSRTSCELEDSTVSIPFKREGVSKALADEKVLADDLLSFNSLQTGRCIQSGNGWTVRPWGQRFQFPSNGKVYPKITELSTRIADLKSQKFQFPSNGKVYPKICPQAE